MKRAWCQALLVRHSSQAASRSHTRGLSSHLKLSKRGSVSRPCWWEKFRPGEEAPAEYGRWQDWNIDMVPKFMMGNGRGLATRPLAI